jgi:hypothetical protein
VGDRGTGIRVVRWRDPAAFTVGVERREFAAGHSLLVTDPARTVVDLFWPLSGATEGGAREALARLYRTGGDEAMNLCTTYANSFRPARREAVTAAVETLRETVKWTAFP